MKRLEFLCLAALLVASCGSDSEDGASMVTVSGQVATAKSNGVLNAKGVSALDLSALRMNCVAFNASATSGSSDFDSSGNFSVEIPADVPFGCFVIKKNDLSVVATLKVKDTATGMEDESSSSLALGKSVNMGSLTLTEGNPVMEVPKSAITDAVTTKTPSISIDDIHQTEWSLTCVDASDSACDTFVTESPKVYMRLLKATKSSKNIYGLGVWASSTAFGNCGSIDMNTTEAGEIVTEEGGDFTWTQNTTGASWSSDNTACPLRDGMEARGMDNLQNYYAIDKLVVSGNMYTLNSEDETNNGSCYWYHKTSVTFSPSSSSVMYGSFEVSDIVTDISGCGDSDVGTDNRNSFVVKFTKL